MLFYGKTEGANQSLCRHSELLSAFSYIPMTCQMLPVSQ